MLVLVSRKTEHFRAGTAGSAALGYDTPGRVRAAVAYILFDCI